MNKCMQCGKEFTGCRKTQKCCCIRCATNYRYANGFKANTEAMHQTLRDKGHYKRDNNYLKTNNPATRVVA